jgi:AcrR family transcriptional regulator
MEMSRPTRKRSKTRAESKQATRMALIAAGVEELAKHGLDASLDAICARAKLTRGAFYVHFADRDAFIVAVMQHVLGSFVSALTQARPGAGGVAAAIDLYFAIASSRSPIVHGGSGLRFHHLLEACRRSPTIGDTYRQLLVTGRDQLAALLERDQRAGRVRAAPEPVALADFMIIAVLGIATMFELELPIDVARLGTTMRAVIGAT